MDLDLRTKERYLDFDDADSVLRYGAALQRAGLGWQKERLPANITLGGFGSYLLNTPGEPIEMVLVPGGKFTMGSPETEAGRWNDEHQTEETVESFYMSKHCISNKDYKTFGSESPDDDRPVVNVSWHDCVKFCEWSGSGLPTEVEWEYAARAGTQTPYFWGETFEQGQAFYRRTYETTKTLKPNAFGLYGMLGNIWQWCEDYYIVDLRSLQSGGSARVLRGGSWGSAPLNCRSAYRCRDDPGIRLDNFGFRVSVVRAAQ